MTDGSKGPAQQRYSAGGIATGVMLFFSLVLFVAGLLLFGYAFDAGGLEALLFCLGIAAISLSMFLPMSLIKFIDGA